MKTREEYLKKFNRLVNEYVSPSSTVEEDGGQDPMAADAQQPGQDQMQADPMAGAAQQPAQDPMQADPMAAGAQQPGQDPMQADPMAGAQGAGAAPQDMAMQPDAMQVQTDDAIQPDTSAESEPSDEGDESDDDMLSDDEFDEEANAIKKSQKHVAQKIDKLSDQFKELLGKLDSFEDRINSNDQKISDLKVDMEKRNPTPVEKMSLRTVQSTPYGDTPSQYWEKKEETSNYSPEDDNDGADMPEYQIKQSDVDSIRDWTNISKSFDDERHGLKDILGY